MVVLLQVVLLPVLLFTQLYQFCILLEQWRILLQEIIHHHCHQFGFIALCDQLDERIHCSSFPGIQVDGLAVMPLFKWPQDVTWLWLRVI